MNLDYEAAKVRARANSDYFLIPYYVTTTTLGYEVTRDKPSDESRILFIAQPAKRKP